MAGSFVEWLDRIADTLIAFLLPAGHFRSQRGSRDNCRLVLGWLLTRRPQFDHKTRRGSRTALRASPFMLQWNLEAVREFKIGSSSGHGRSKRSLDAKDVRR